MTTDAVLLLAAGENMSPHHGGPGVTTFALTLLLGMALPLIAIAFAVMLPLRCKRSSHGDDAAVGLGDRSLQEEFWEFIDDVERGRVALADVPATADLGAVSLPGRQVGEQQADGP